MSSSSTSLSLVGGVVSTVVTLVVVVTLLLVWQTTTTPTTKVRKRRGELMTTTTIRFVPHCHETTSQRQGNHPYCRCHHHHRCCCAIRSNGPSNYGTKKPINDVFMRPRNGTMPCSNNNNNNNRRAVKGNTTILATTLQHDRGCNYRRRRPCRPLPRGCGGVVPNKVIYSYGRPCHLRGQMMFMLIFHLAVLLPRYHREQSYRPRMKCTNGMDPTIHPAACHWVAPVPSPPPPPQQQQQHQHICIFTIPGIPCNRNRGRVSFSKLLHPSMATVSTVSMDTHSYKREAWE